ncbi:GNAT family N-acetyltransferase [uncultured Maritalea sp.]|uniref:GNAT family N-acetyltransferase n=1 Tax=uncultured Maritalea sp. TaxID=757249 RepID=UPI00263834F8|nr:GNAT family N-acetyltransferase [uncultured Maritalea sp.]
MAKAAVVLEKIAPHHCAALLRFELENASYFSGFVPPRAPEMLTEVGMSHAIAALELDMRSQEGLYFVGLIGDEVVGRINFTIGGDQAEVGYRVAERWLGKGIAGQMLALGVEMLCADYKINRLIGRVMTTNLGSTRVLERAGFSQFSIETGGGEQRGFGGDMVSFERWLV